MVSAWSFAYAMVATRLDQAAAYYSTFARAWELLAGAVLALVIDRIRLPRRQRALLAAIGIVGVLSCGLVLDGAAVFPGPATLWPVGATLLLIVAGSGGDEPVVTRLVGAAPLVWLGGIAYALYLWHWPVLIFTLAARKSPAVGVATGCAVIAASIVEREVRHVEDAPKVARVIRNRLDRDQLLQHEAFVHSLTALNGRLQPVLKSMELPSPRTTATPVSPL